MDSTTTRTKTITTYDTDIIRSIRPTVSQRSLLISRSSNYGPVGGGGGRSSSHQYSGTMAVPGGSFGANTGVNSVKSARDKEKREMQDLNERFAGYIEKVRFLEAQNRRLADELEKLKAKWGKETELIKKMYTTELDEARRLLEESEKEKARLEVRIAALEEQLEDLRNKVEEAKRNAADSREQIEQQNQQLSNIEAEINLLRRRVELLDGDHDRDKRRIAQLQDAINRARIDLDNETLLHIDAENRRQALEEELEFLKNVHEQEMKELAALAYRDTTNENREFWKSEMGSALRDIQTLYDDKLDSMQGEMDTFYNMKVQEFRTGATRQNMDAVHSKEETTRLKTQYQDLKGKLNDLEAKNAALLKELENLRQEKDDRERELENEHTDLQTDVAKMRAEMEAIMKELQLIMDTKLGLELEIAAYRKLLEGEENRDGLRQVVDSMFNRYTSAIEGRPMDDDSTLRVNQSVIGDVSMKTTFQKTAKGPLAITESSADGRSIVLENNGRKEENASSWSIKSTVDGVDTADFTLPTNFNLKAGSKIKLYASGCKPSSASDTDIETNVKTWGVGKNITIRLVNPSGEDRAQHVQKTVMAS